jgi:hypothetical protein
VISISQSNTFHCILVPRLILRSSTIWEIIVELLQQGLIVLQVTCSGMEAQDTHEDILVVGQVGHSLDILNVDML